MEIRPVEPVNPKEQDSCFQLIIRNEMGGPMVSPPLGHSEPCEECGQSSKISVIGKVLSPEFEPKFKRESFRDHDICLTIERLGQQNNL